MQFDGNASFSILKEPKCLRRRLHLLRALFQKEEVSTTDLATLMAVAQCLLHFASRCHPAQLEGIPPVRAVEPAARRFLIVDALWSICTVVGSEMNQSQWWGRLMKHTEIPKSLLSNPPSGAPFSHRRFFLISISNALEEFRHGKRPSPEEVVALKRIIFCDSKFSSRFSNRAWYQWRKDDEDHRRATGAS